MGANWLTMGYHWEDPNSMNGCRDSGRVLDRRIHKVVRMADAANYIYASNNQILFCLKPDTLPVNHVNEGHVLADLKGSAD